MAQEEAFSACIGAHRRQNEGPGGKLLMQWRILPSGETRDVVALTQSPPPSLLSCLTATITAMHFRRHTVAAADPVTFPFSF